MVEGLADGAALLVHTVDLGAEHAEHAIGDLGADDPADEAAALGADLLLDEGVELAVLAIDDLPQLGQQEAQDLVVAVAVDEGAEGAGHDRAAAGAAEHAGGEAGHGAAGAAVFHGGQDAGEHLGERLGGGTRRGAIGEEAGEDGGHVEPPEHATDLAGRDDVPGDEGAEGAAEPGLLPRDDGGVRDGDAERVTEQGGDREPVREAAHEPGLGAGLNEVRPEALGHGVAHDDEGGHGQEQSEGEALVADEVAPELGVGGGGGRHGLGFSMVVGRGHPRLAGPSPRPSP